jgi:hypothetical protein
MFIGFVHLPLVFTFMYFGECKYLDRLSEWAVENAMKINPSKSKAFSFTKARVKDPLDDSLQNTLIPEATSCE